MTLEADTQKSAPTPPRTEGPSNARDTYGTRLLERQQVAAELGQEDRLVANMRLTVFLLGLFVAYLSTQQHLFSAAWIWPVVVAFMALMRRHQRVLERLHRAQRAVLFYQEGLLRLDDQWAGRGVAGDRYLEASHPYSADLDIFGRGSVFELLCAARTRPGEDRLAAWLLAPASAPDLRARQAAVEELRSRLDLREDLAVLSSTRGQLHGDTMTRWSEAPRLLPGVALRLLALLLGVLGAAAAVYWLSTWDPRLLGVAVVVQQIVLAWPASGLTQVMQDVRGPLKDLETLHGFLSRLEQETFSTPLLSALTSPLRDSPSRQVARLLSHVQYLEAQQNLVFKPVASILMWSLQFGYAVENWRSQHGAGVRGWLEIVAEMEALLSLANHGYEHPADPFAHVQDAGTLLVGEGLGHPLLPEATCVRNDVRFDDECRLYVVSGSNMSGKSSYLRTLGVNTVLALAGAPVRGRSLRLAPVAVGASLLVGDSLREGVSRFYAEIRKLRLIMDLAGQALPLLFLLDEMLQGTNSYDRGIGATAVISALVERGAIGAVTTHDLNLTHMVDGLSNRARNVHFEDHLQDGEMRFDYQLRPGVVEKSNAVALMRAVGLPV